MFIAERGFRRKLSLLVQVVRLWWFEPLVWRQANAVFHISFDEYERAKERRGVHLWVPPIFAEKGAPSGVPVWDVGILSSWFSSHKQEGIIWFAEHVLPHLDSETKVVVAGSSAPEWLPGYLELKGIRFLGTVDSPEGFYTKCSVLVNPVLRGAGVNMKILEMISSGRPVISTSAGLAGLPPAVRDELCVSDSASELASQIRRCLQGAFRLPAPAALEKFGPRCVGELLVRNMQEHRK